MQEQTVKQSSKKKWYTRWWGILILVFIFIPFLSGLLSSGSTKTESNTSQTTSPLQSATIPYEGVEIWKIGDNGLGTTIVIDPEYDNVESLKQLGSELNEENRSRQFATNYVYTDKTSALYRAESFCSPSQSATIRAHKQNWAALYQKDNSGAKMTIFTDRSCDPDAKTETIRYQS